MRLPGTQSLVFLFFLLLWMPWMAIRARARLFPRPEHGGSAAKPVPSRTRIFTSTLVSLTLLFLLTWLTGRDFGYRIVAAPPIGAREVLAGAGALAALFALMLLNRAIRSPAVFAVSHALQGWKSGAVIFLMALVFQGLVWLTGTLVVAMVVHAVYDISAGVIGAWRLRTGRVEG
jgi:hypothetical protein